MVQPLHQSGGRSFRVTDLIPPAARRPATLLVLLFIFTTTVFILFAPTSVAPTTNSAKQYISEEQNDPYSAEKQDHDPVFDKHESSHIPNKQDGTPKQDRGPISPDYISHFPDGHLPTLFDDPLYTTLSDRLIRFLNRPTYTHEESRDYMTEHCPLDLAEGLVNPDQYKGSIHFWRDEVGRDVILDKRAELVRYLEGRVKEGEKVIWEEGMGGGQGIVMTGGNKVSSTDPSESD